MKTVTYSGPSLQLGRFGVVEDGATLQVTEAEFLGIQDDPRFSLLSRRRLKSEAMPAGTPFFDLRIIEWESKNLDNDLLKKGKSTLKNIAEAINFVGGELVVTEHDNDDVIADAIGAEARYFGWDKLGKEARLGLAVQEKAVAVKQNTASQEKPAAPLAPEETDKPEEVEEVEAVEESTAKRRRR